MGTPNLQVRKDSSPSSPWGSSIQVKTGEQFTLQYKIAPEGQKTIRVAFPLYNGTTNNIPKETAFMNIADWSALQVSMTGASWVKNPTLSGTFDITSDGNAEIIFSITGKATFAEIVERATCKLSYKSGTGVAAKWNDAGSIEIKLTQDLTAPYIGKFTAERIVLASGDFTTLNWSVSNSDKIELYKDGGLVTISTPGTYFANGLSKDTRFVLKAMNGTIVREKELTIKVFNSSDIAIQTNTFVEKHEEGKPIPERKLMNLYVYEEKIYALVLEESTKDVYMWESYEGFNWSKTVLGSNYVSFANAKNSNKVPLDFAGSPSVVFQDKVFLIGGSRFNANILSNEVYFYAYNDTDKGWQKMAAPATMFSPRMGHSCVVYNNNSQIWVLGGCTEFGASNGIWTFDGTIWAKSNGNLPENRAMASVIVMGNGQELQLFGGVGDIPGTPDKSILDSYSFNGQKWTKIEWANGMANPRYLACEAGVVNNNRFIFSAINQNATYSHRCQRIVGNALENIKDQGNWLISDYIYDIQAVTFKDVIWLCSITQNVGIQSNNLRYLAYVPK